MQLFTPEKAKSMLKYEASEDNLHFLYPLRAGICIAESNRMPAFILHFCCRLVPQGVGQRSTFKFTFKAMHLERKHRKEKYVS